MAKHDLKPNPETLCSKPPALNLEPTGMISTSCASCTACTACTVCSKPIVKSSPVKPSAVKPSGPPGAPSPVKVDRYKTKLCLFHLQGLCPPPSSSQPPSPLWLPAASLPHPTPPPPRAPPHLAPAPRSTSPARASLRCACCSAERGKEIFASCRTWFCLFLVSPPPSRPTLAMKGRVGGTCTFPCTKNPPKSVSLSPSPAPRAGARALPFPFLSNSLSIYRSLLQEPPPPVFALE